MSFDQLWLSRFKLVIPVIQLQITAASIKITEFNFVIFFFLSENF